MTESRTKQAARKQRDANREHGIALSMHPDKAFINRREAERLDREAAELLTLSALPEISIGEVVPDGGGPKAAMIRNTLESPAQTALDASSARTDLLLQEAGDCTALAIDAAASIGASNSLEKMLAHQLARVHQAGFEIMAKADKLLQRVGNPAYTPSAQAFASVEGCRLFNAGNRMFQTYQHGLMTLQRMRTGGTQTVTVQHVHISDGGQALIGNLGGAPGTGGRNGG